MRLSITIAVGAAALAAPLAALRPQSASFTVVERAEWRAPFDSAGVEGTFALRRLGSSTVEAYDAARAARGFIPASTFKIPNSLIALETGIVRDERQRFPFSWPRASIAAWNRDHTFRTALKYSVVPVYQQIAREVGEARYGQWLARLDYGNRDPHGGVDHFWLDGDLRTSALQQIDFLSRLAELRLPLSERSQRIVSAMLVQEANACWVLRAKTGLAGISATREVEPIGWYVGWVETDTATWAFAMNIHARKDGDSAARIPITKSLLARAGVIPAGGCGG